MLLANLRPEVSKTKPPEPPDTDAPPRGRARPLAIPTSPLATPEESIPPVLLTVAPMPPTPEIPKPTVSEKATASVSQPTEAAEPKDLGRGLALHKSIQKRLQDGARKLGFIAEVEKQLAKGSNNAADLVLRHDGLKVAVEIAISPSISHEFENVQKCLAAGFIKVAVIATGRMRLENIAAAVQSGLGPEAAAKVSYHTPDEFLVELQTLAKAAEATPSVEPVARPDKILGLQVTRSFPKLSPEEQRLSQQSVYEVALKAIQKPPHC